MSTLEGQYRRLLRWYPKQWRARNEAAVTGALLDEAESEGRMTPSFDNRASLVIGGLHERFLRVERPSAVTAVGLGLAAAFSIWYLAVISWSPGIPAYSGTVGPFSNPAVTTGVICVAAFALLMARRVQLARIVSLVGAVWALALLILNLSLGWLGPGEAATALFIGFGVVGALRVSRWRDLAVSVVAVLFATLSIAEAQIAMTTFPVIYVAQFWVASLISIASGAAAILLVAGAFVQREVRSATPALPSP